MTISLSVLAGPQYIEQNISVLYTATNSRAIIDKFTVTNVYASDLTFSVHIVPKGGEASATNQIIKARGIAPSETYTCPELTGHIVPDNGTIQAIASYASGLVVYSSGRGVS